MRGKQIIIVSLVLVATLVLVSDEASARRRGGLIIINTGEVIHPVAPLPAELVEANPDLEGWQLGYMCSHFGILWADVWSWNKQLVVFKDDTYSDLPPELKAQLEQQYSFSDCDRNLWNRYGMIVITGGLIGLGVFKGSGSD